MSFFEQLLLILAVSLITALLFRRLRLSSIVAYIVVGCVLGPYATGSIAEPEQFSFLAEFGVAFLLFALGLEFSLAKMLSLRFAVFGLGSLQVLVCTIIFGIAVYLWGTSLEAALMIAGALTLSSTAIVTRELSNQQQFNSRYAQLSIGVLLFQDLIAVVFLILVPVLGSGSTENFIPVVLISLAKGLLLFIVLMAIGKWILPKIYHEVARSSSDEIFVLTTLVIALLAAWLTHHVGLSMALGSFVIGMMLSESTFKHQINNDIRPFKDVLLGLFFVTIGMNIDLTLIQDYWFRILYMAMGLIVIKALVITCLIKMMGDDLFTSLRSGITLGQAGEFGLALLTLAYVNQILPLDQASFVVLIAILSMLASPWLIRNSDQISKFILSALSMSAEQKNHSPTITLYNSGHVIIGGFGRVGQTIGNLLDANNVPYIGIEQNIDIITECRERGNNVVYGDCTRMEILESCHINHARLAILTFRSVELASNTIHQIRSKNIEVPIIVRCYEHGNFEELVSLGADWVVPEMLEASLTIGEQVLTILNIDDDSIEQQIDETRKRILGEVKSG